jgi:hypothetical protein
MPTAYADCGQLPLNLPLAALYRSVGRSHPKLGSISFGHTRCRHQCYGDAGFDCRAVASLCMAEVALGADTWPDHGGGWEISGARHGDTANTTSRCGARLNPLPGQVVR